MAGEKKKLLAMDFGGSTGRGILGQFDGSRLSLDEVHRFPNYFVNQNGMYFWDVYRLFHEIQHSIKEVRKKYGRHSLQSLGIDTWGTDYGLLDHNGQLLGNVRCMRNADGIAVKEVQNLIGKDELFLRTGLQTIPGNTLFQLYERMKKKDPSLLHADKMLMLSDLMGYFLTGEIKEDYTMATTSMCINPYERKWDTELIKELGIPEHIFSEIVYPGENQAPVLKGLQEELGTEGLRYITVGTHDTASAVAATPLGKDEAFCSSGTWSLLGIETDEAIINDKVLRGNFSNEGTVDGKFRLLKNIMGMWLIQECTREWQDEGISLTWDELVYEASKAEPYQSFLDTELPELYNAGQMNAKIRNYCAKTGQKVPSSVGETARCIYESLAMRYRMTVEQLEEITGRKIQALSIVGGGSQNKMLNQYTANVLGIPVYSGPAEAACSGNLLTQCIAQGELKDLTELRQVIEHSFERETFFPRDMHTWEEGYQAYRAVIMRKEEE